MWKSRAGHAAENLGHWPSERWERVKPRTALLEGPKPARGNPRLSLWHARKTNRPCLIWRTAVYGPVCTVVWEGGVSRLPPLPITHGRLCPIETARPISAGFRDDVGSNASRLEQRGCDLIGRGSPGLWPGSRRRVPHIRHALFFKHPWNDAISSSLCRSVTVA
jgi:hypothetical protein